MKLTDDIDRYGTDIEVYSLRSLVNGRHGDYYIDVNSLPNIVVQGINGLQAMRITIGLLFNEIKSYIDENN